MIRRASIPRIYYLGPEAAMGGPIALVNPGDTVSIDITHRTINVEVSEAELATRKSAWKPRPPRITYGCLAKYAAMATSADSGAVLKWD